MGYYGIGAVVAVAGALGVAYFALGSNESPEQAGGTPDVSVVDNTAPAGVDAAPQSTLQGSADRRMDDFGAGPGSNVVTVPLRNRHQQAYAGGTASGGGPAVIPSDGASEPGQATAQQVETAGLSPEAGDEDAVPEPSYRVIERPADDQEEATGDVSVEAEPEADIPPSSVSADTSPSFDVIRVDPDGRTVIAGRPAPLTDVEIKVGSDVIDRVKSSAVGEWVSIPLDPLKPGDQELSLMAMPEDGVPIESRQIVVVSVPEAAGENSPDQAVAVVVDKEEGGEGRILQAPDKLQRDGDERLALKLVDYDDQGAIKLSGEAPPGVPVRVYVDNEPAALVIGNSKGYWITTLDQSLPAGDYTLRLDQLDQKGQTVARLETPLTRVATPPAKGEAEVDYVVVQPGNSLWRIARRLSGDGFNYVYIFEANQTQIRDPDIIYPGQVFEVPTDVSAEIAG